MFFDSGERLIQKLRPYLNKNSNWWDRQDYPITWSRVVVKRDREIRVDMTALGLRKFDLNFTFLLGITLVVLVYRIEFVLVFTILYNYWVIYYF